MTDLSQLEQQFDSMLGSTQPDVPLRPLRLGVPSPAVPVSVNPTVPKISKKSDVGTVLMALFIGVGIGAIGVLIADRITRHGKTTAS